MQNLQWQAKAACRNLPTEWWYSDDQEVGKQAIEVCETCPVVEECLNWGLLFEQWGIWGGKTQSERQRIRAKRGITMIAPQAWGSREIPHNCGTEAGYQYLLRHAEPDAPKGKKVTCADCLAAHRRKVADSYQNSKRPSRSGQKPQVIATEMKRMGLIRRRNIGWLDQNGRLLSEAELKAIRTNIREQLCQ